MNLDALQQQMREKAAANARNFQVNRAIANLAATLDALERNPKTKTLWQRAKEKVSSVFA